MDGQACSAHSDREGVSATADDCLLIVEAHAELRELLTRQFEHAGYRVVATDTGSAALSLARRARPDVVLLDLGVPDISGISVFDELRCLTHAPIVLLTADGSPATAARAIESGAADYVRKPVDLRELVARIGAARRVGVPTNGGGAIRMGPLRIDEAEGLAAFKGRDIGLSAAELRLLSLLARRPDVVFSKDQLVTALCSGDRTTHVIEVHVSNTRRKLRSVGCHEGFIKTVPGMGYKFSAGRPRRT